MLFAGDTLHVVSSQIKNNQADIVRAAISYSYPLPQWNDAHTCFLCDRAHRVAACIPRATMTYRLL